MGLLDFAPGYKTIAGAIVFVLGYYGHTVDTGTVLDAITAIMTSTGALISAYGLVMKAIRNIQ